MGFIHNKVDIDACGVSSNERNNDESTNDGCDSA
jgi:hypothetical protein